MSTIKEQFDPNIKIALFSNFSNAYEAIEEIIDNSVGHRIIGDKLIVKLFFIPKSKKLVIEDRGGQGMSADDLESFFNWGKSKSRSEYDIGLYSQGGKAAIGYLGSSFVLRTSPTGSNSTFQVQDDNIFDTRKLKEYEVKNLNAKTKDGYTEIEIGGLKVHITDNFKIKLEEILANTYRPLLENGEMDLFIDGAQVKPESFPIDKEFKNENIDFLYLGHKAWGWIGRLAPRTGLKGGMKCYYKGRLISDRQFFEHPDPTHKGTLNFLFGEVFLDFAPVNTNKTDFRRDSEEWVRIEEKMHTILTPHIDELLGRKIEEPTDEDINRVKKARDLFQAILKAMKNPDSIGPNFQGDDVGQKPPIPKEGQPSKTPPGSSRGENKPKTPPPTDKMGNRRRLRKFMDWEVRSMDEAIRSKIEEKDGGKILVINNLFPGYKQSRANNFYLLETAALQTVPIEDTTLTPAKYLEEFDHFFGRICESMDEAKEMMDKKKLGN